MEEIRIDKYLWAIRVFKTRTDATDACKGGKVKVGTVNAKPSRAVAPGEIITVRKGVATFTYRVIQLVDHRLGAKLVPDYAENLTPEEELNKLKAPVETFFVTRDRGTGRPTKKDRRALEQIWDAIDFSEE
jgi:ribosome-associated heat shock protein Hsp15